MLQLEDDRIGHNEMEDCNKLGCSFVLDCCGCVGEVAIRVATAGVQQVREGEVTCCFVVSAVVLFRPTLDDILSSVDDYHSHCEL